MHPFGSTALSLRPPPLPKGLYTQSTSAHAVCGTLPTTPASSEGAQWAPSGARFRGTAHLHPRRHLRAAAAEAHEPADRPPSLTAPTSSPTCPGTAARGPVRSTPPSYSNAGEEEQRRSWQEGRQPAPGSGGATQCIFLSPETISHCANVPCGYGPCGTAAYDGCEHSFAGGGKSLLPPSPTPHQLSSSPLSAAESSFAAIPPKGPTHTLTGLTPSPTHPHLDPMSTSF